MQIVIENLGDAAELEELRLDLANEIELLPVTDVQQLSAGEAPPGARAIDMAVVGGLLVKLGPTGVKAVMSAVRGWLNRSQAKSVELWIDGDHIRLTKATSEEQERLVRLFEERHGQGA